MRFTAWRLSIAEEVKIITVNKVNIRARYISTCLNILVKNPHDADIVYILWLYL